jgi:NAD(P)H dehydrogenase (quinone)
MKTHWNRKAPGGSVSLPRGAGGNPSDPRHIMSVRVKVIFYSLYGHVFRLAEAIAEGARSVSGAQVELLQVAETLPADVIAKMGATEAKKAFAHIPLADPKKLPEADALLFGTGTRYGSATAQMQAFFDNTGPLWTSGALVGKVGGVFTSTATQHGGQETTLISMQTFLFHQGMAVVGVPYACEELLNMNEITGGSPYGASTITGAKGERMPSENELAIARYQGKHTTQIAAKVAAK